MQQEYLTERKSSASTKVRHMGRVVWVLLGEGGQLGEIIGKETAVSLLQMSPANVLRIDDVPDSVFDAQLLMLVRWRIEQLKGYPHITYNQLVQLRRIDR